MDIVYRHGGCSFGDKDAVSAPLHTKPMPWDPLSTTPARSARAKRNVGALFFVGAHAEAATPMTCDAPTIPSRAIQANAPIRWPRVSEPCLRWMNTRPMRPSVMQSEIMAQEARISGGEFTVMYTMLPAIRRDRRETWMGNDLRKSSAANSD